MKKFLPLWITLAVLAVLLGLVGVMLATATVSCTVEAGGALPPPSAYGRYPFLPLTGRAVVDDTAEPGRYHVLLDLWGISLTSTLQVVDTTPPTVTALPQRCFLGEPIASDALVAVDDVTPCRTAYVTPPDFTIPGLQQVRVAVTDGGGNTTEIEVPLTVYGIAHTIPIESGIDPEVLRREIADAVEGEIIFDEDPAALDLATPGEQLLAVTLDGESAKLRLEIADTIPPEAVPVYLELLRGDRAAPINFLRDIVDATPVTVEFVTEPDFSPGMRSVALLLRDAGGNTTTKRAALQVYDVPDGQTIEFGTPYDELCRLLIADGPLTLVEDTSDMQTLREAPLPGTYEIAMRSPRGTLMQLLTLADTTPPTASAPDRTVYVGDTPDASLYVTDIVDATAVTVAFAGDPPDLSQPAALSVPLVLTDAGGNKTELSVALTVIHDTTPPVLYGVSDKVVYVGETVSYRTGVSAWDNRDGSVSVKINSSGVNLRVEGSYPVTYTATDKAGNTTEKTVTFTVRDVNLDSVNTIADGILKTILQDGMTERERLRAIYDWSVSHLRYTAYPDKTDPVGAAYYGFRNGRGDCFVYYAVTRFLLTRAGVENLEIHRNIPNQPHFWNLVKFEGNWYHLDTCPHYAAHPLTCFLLTDAEVKAYSETRVKNYYSFDASLYPATP